MELVTLYRTSKGLYTTYEEAKKNREKEYDRGFIGKESIITFHALYSDGLFFELKELDVK